MTASTFEQTVDVLIPTDYQERVSESIIEQIVDVPVPKNLEEIVELKKISCVHLVPHFLFSFSCSYHFSFFLFPLWAAELYDNGKSGRKEKI